jgi:hypothetical protein
LERPADLGSLSVFGAALGSVNYIIMHVMLSVPVPSDMVMSPFAIPWSIISSIMKDVSPGGFGLFKGSDFYLLARRGLLLLFPVFFGFKALGPFSRLVRTNLAAYSFEKQSHIPSQATIMKSRSDLIGTFLMSGNEDT